jgi:Flp pilus assembly protein TadB
MGAEDVLRVQAEELERKAKGRWFWYGLTAVCLLVTAYAALTVIPVLIAAGAVVSVVAIACAVMAERAGKQARLLRAQLA